MCFFYNCYKKVLIKSSIVFSTCAEDKMATYKVSIVQYFLYTCIYTWGWSKWNNILKMVLKFIWQRGAHLEVPLEVKKIWGGEKIWLTGVKTLRSLTSNITVYFMLLMGLVDFKCRRKIANFSVVFFMY